MNSLAAVPILAAMLWAALAGLGGETPSSQGGPGAGGHHAACGAIVGQSKPAASRDTLFTAWFTDAENDSGYDLVAVDRSGDTLALYLQLITGANPHLRVWGPLAGTARAGQKRLWRFHRLRMLDPGEFFESGTDLTTQGANSRMSGINLTRLCDTADSIVWRQTWQSIKATGARDTVEVSRTVVARRGEPYFVIRYDLTWLGGADRVRFIWSNHPRMGAQGSVHDVGFAPGLGLVTAQRTVEASRTGWWAAFLDIGNPLAAVDTLEGGESSFLSPALRMDFGSGGPEFAAAFVCFNPGRAIVPAEFVWADSTGAGEASLDFDSPTALLDTTRVLDSGHRTLIARTPPVEFLPGETKTLEYAVGRARLEGDRLPPVFPEVKWSDGTTSVCPAGPAEGRSPR